MIFCNCKKGCGATCGCRKIGLFCNSTCATCSGDNCLNCAPIVDQDEDEEEEQEEENDDDEATIESHEVEQGEEEDSEDDF